jgi:hypothetical protein
VSYDGLLEKLASQLETQSGLRALVDTFATCVLNSHNSPYLTTDITALDYISVGEAQADHEFIKDASDIFNVKVSIERRGGREGVAGYGRHN